MNYAHVCIIHSALAYTHYIQHSVDVCITTTVAVCPSLHLTLFICIPLQLNRGLLCSIYRSSK